MRTYANIDQMWLDTLQQIHGEGVDLPSRDGPCREILGWSGRLLDPTAHFLLNPIRKCSPSYTAAEVLWYLSGQRVVHALTPYAPQYTRFCNEATLHLEANGDETTVEPGKYRTQSSRKTTLYAHGAYGYRMSRRIGNYTALTNIIRMLKLDPNTRQAVLPLYDAGMDMEKATSGDKKDIPCTLTLNFLLRDGKLNLHVNMRSNDIWLGLPHDVFAFTCIQMLIASCLDVEVGWYQHSAMSMHLYERNKEKAFQAMDEVYHSGSVGYYRPKLGTSISNAISMSVVEEAYIRANKDWNPNNQEVLKEVPLLHQLVLMTALKWADNKEGIIHHISNPLMKQYMEKHWC